MPVLQSLPEYRVFLSSPGDVADERGLARRVVEELSAEPFLRRARVRVSTVSWDDPAAPTPMLANLTPQAALERGLPKPSECDVVVVILWSRMGTPLLADEYCKPTGEPYLSGTEWEFEDALATPCRPDILVYRRTEQASLGLDDPKRDEKIEQWERVTRFFEGLPRDWGCETGRGTVRPVIPLR